MSHSQWPSDHTYLCTGAAYLAAFLPYLHDLNDLFGILYRIVYICQCYDLSSLFPSFHFLLLRLGLSLSKLKTCLYSCRRYGRFPLILISSVTTGLTLVLINKSTIMASSLQELLCSLFSIFVADNTLVYC